MKNRKITSILFILFGLNLLIYGDENKTHLFPVFSLKSDIAISQKYTSELKTNLMKTGIFNIFLLDNFNSELKNQDNIFDKIKSIVKDKCKESKIKSAIFGYLIEGRYGYKLKMVLYSVNDDNIVSMYNDNIYNIDSIPRSAKGCALEFAVRLNSIKGSKIFFSSLIMPGLGQFMMKKYIKGTVFIGGFCYLAAKLLDTDEIRTVEDKTFTRYLTGSGYVYEINSREVSYKEWIRRQENYEYTRNRNEELKKRKRKLQIYVGVVYLLNVIDALRLINNLNDKRKIEQKLSIDLNPFYSKSLVKLNYRF